MKLIPIQYHKRKYPEYIKPEIDEISGHFDIIKKASNRKFSLHTEYSYGKRKLNSELISSFPNLKNSHKDNVPKLWHSEEWALEFADFIKSLCNGSIPTIIEIHPPFNDYITSVSKFLDIYKIFEDSILLNFPESKILIENRTGSMYKGGKFLISKEDSINELCELITSKNLKLRIALDIPQLLTAYGGPQNFNEKTLETILNSQNQYRSFINSIHLWGKRKSLKGRTISHCGDLNSYFENNKKKKIFLNWLSNFLQDDKPRYFVPEVNSTDEDLHSIINDLERINIKFE